MSARHLLRGDVTAAAHCLARAFSEDPLTRWLSDADQSDDRVERLAEGFFTPALEVGIGRGHTYVVPGASDLDAAAIWSPPDVAMVDEVGGMAFYTAFSTVYGEGAAARLMTLDSVLSGYHPAEPHFYLFIVGASVHGRGAGARAMAPVLDRCDADGLGSYLESSNTRNLGFYGRLGFEPVWEERLESDGPLLTGMWREPR